MSLFIAHRLSPVARIPNFSRFSCYRYLSTKSCDPLRILFLGSEEFSIASLRALYQERLGGSAGIESIDVVCRPGKRVGRGLKNVKHPPIKSVANDLRLPVHEIDTFKGWTPPIISNEPVNLIIAVSFGLFVPKRILTAAKYGGLNVHPSLLPDFRGPAPLHHTLLASEAKTGVTLQTLDTEHFDHGVILDQTPPPGIDIPVECTVPQLQELLASEGAQMLVRGIRERLFVPPVQDVGWYAKGVKDENLRHAPKIKITDKDCHIDWQAWTAEVILRRYRVLGPLWNFARPSVSSESLPAKRMKFSKLGLASSHPIGELQPGLPYGPVAQSTGNSRESFFVNTCDGKTIEISAVTIEGSKAGQAIGPPWATVSTNSVSKKGAQQWRFSKALS